MTRQAGEADQRGVAGESAGPRSAGPPAALELVVAVAENDAIGRGNQLPWTLPADLRHFKALTMGRSILMGRKTYESIGRALPGRTTWVLTRSPEFAPHDCRATQSIDAARGGSAVLMVVGGAEVYRLCMPDARRIHLTLVHTRVDDGDTFFSDWRSGDWRESAREFHDADAQHAVPYSFITLDRLRPSHPCVPAGSPRTL